MNTKDTLQLERTQRKQNRRHRSQHEKGTPLLHRQSHIHTQHSQDAQADDQLVDGAQRASQFGGCHLSAHTARFIIERNNG